MPWGRPKIANVNLRRDFSQEAIGNMTTASGRFNTGIYVVRRHRDSLKCIEKCLRPKEIVCGAARMEMSLLRQLCHINITEYIDGFIAVQGANPQASIYMEYCNRGTLADAIRNGTLLEERTIWNLLAQITNAVAYCQYGIEDAVYHPHGFRDPSWRGIIHRDIKPANIFFRADSRSGTRAILGDFGLAIRMEDDGINWSGGGGGYLARNWACPEHPSFTFASDVWSVGMVVQAACRRQTEGWGLRFYGLGSRYSSRLNDAVYEIMREDPFNRPRIHHFAPKLAEFT